MRLLIALAMTFATGAHAAWDIQRFTDPLTDRTYASAELLPTTGPGKLAVHCVNGGATADLVFPRVIGFGEIGANYRFDDASVVMRIAPIATSGRDIWMWLHDAESIRRMTKAKRLRVQLFPVASEPVFIDFDMTGAAEAISQVRCGAHAPDGHYVREKSPSSIPAK